MGAFEDWLAQRGPAIARALDAQREPICTAVSSRLAMSFPSLCFNPARADAHHFQQLIFRETPRRFHRLMQVVLGMQTLQVITREYSWGWPVVARYGVQRHHVLALVRWYFEAAQGQISLLPTDQKHMYDLSVVVIQRVASAIGEAPQQPTNGVAHT